MAWCMLRSMQKFVSIQDAQSHSEQAHSCSAPRQQCQHLSFYLSDVNLPIVILVQSGWEQLLLGKTHLSVLCSSLRLLHLQLGCSVLSARHTIGQEGSHSSPDKSPILTSEPNFA